MVSKRSNNEQPEVTPSLNNEESVNDDSLESQLSVEKALNQEVIDERDAWQRLFEQLETHTTTRIDRLAEELTLAKNNAKTSTDAMQKIDNLLTQEKEEKRKLEALVKDSEVMLLQVLDESEVAYEASIAAQKASYEVQIHSLIGKEQNNSDAPTDALVEELNQKKLALTAAENEVALLQLKLDTMEKDHSDGQVEGTENEDKDHSQELNRLNQELTQALEASTLAKNQVQELTNKLEVIETTLTEEKTALTRAHEVALEEAEAILLLKQINELKQEHESTVEDLNNKWDLHVARIREELEQTHVEALNEASLITDQALNSLVVTHEEATSLLKAEVASNKAELQANEAELKTALANSENEAKSQESLKAEKLALEEENDSLKNTCETLQEELKTLEAKFTNAVQAEEEKRKVELDELTAAHETVLASLAEAHTVAELAWQTEKSELVEAARAGEHMHSEYALTLNEKAIEIAKLQHNVKTLTSANENLTTEVNTLKFKVEQGAIAQEEALNARLASLREEEARVTSSEDYTKRLASLKAQIDKRVKTAETRAAAAAEKAISNTPISKPKHSASNQSTSDVTPPPHLPQVPTLGVSSSLPTQESSLPKEDATTDRPLPVEKVQDASLFFKAKDDDLIEEVPASAPTPLPAAPLINSTPSEELENFIVSPPSYNTVVSEELELPEESIKTEEVTNNSELDSALNKPHDPDENEDHDDFLAGSPEMLFDNPLFDADDEPDRNHIFAAPTPARAADDRLFTEGAPVKDTQEVNASDPMELARELAREELDTLDEGFPSKDKSKPKKKRRRKGKK